MAAKDITQMDYFYGFMTKEQAERTLLVKKDHLLDGHFLIRRSIKQPNNFALAICHKNEVHHYIIEPLSNGKYWIPGGRQHATVLDLVQYHRKKQDRLVTAATIPCPRPNGRGPYIWAGVTSDEVQNRLDKLFAAYTANVQPSSRRLALERRMRENLTRCYHRYQCWYSERLEREEAELILNRTKTEMNGKYLLRTNQKGQYCLSVLYNRLVHHYAIVVSINREGYETYSIDGLQQEFKCIMDLLTVCHDISVLKCKLTEPCHIQGERGMLARQRNNVKDTAGSVTSLQRNIVYRREQDKEDDQGSQDDDEDEDEDYGDVFTTRRKEDTIDQWSQTNVSSRTVKTEVSEDLLSDQLYYYGVISRDEAELMLRDQQDATFLVRRRAQDKQYILSRCEVGQVIHSEIMVTLTSRGRLVFSVPDIDVKFDSIAQLIEDTERLVDDMECDGPSEPVCESPSEPVRRRVPVVGERATAVMRATHSRKETTFPRTLLSSHSELDEEEEEEENAKEVDDGPLVAYLDRKLQRISREMSQHAYLARLNSNDMIYTESSTYEDPLFNITEDQLRCIKEIGSGQYGKVYEAVLSTDPHDPTTTQTVAVKTIGNRGGIQSNRKSLRDEGLLMTQLSSPYIIQLIGLCLLEEDRVSLVMELAPGGPLDIYLLKNRDVTLSEILLFDEHVVHGMAYLESEHIVHRDLAARNILLAVSNGRQVAKISDFGLSRLLDSTSDSNVSSSAGHGRVPLKIYPPEFFITNKFDTKADVWSFGLLLWETVSRGRQPYKELSREQYKSEVLSGRYPAPPSNCPETVYTIMKKCWTDRSKRPTFRRLEEMFVELRVSMEETSPTSSSTVRNDESDPEPPRNSSASVAPRDDYQQRDGGGMAHW